DRRSAPDCCDISRAVAQASSLAKRRGIGAAMPKTCFVVGPIGDAGSPTRGHADWLLDEIIQPVFAEHFKDFEVIRSDKIAQPGMIDSEVINHLLDADLVIADLTFQNPNVFYEMGIRH